MVGHGLRLGDSIRRGGRSVGRVIVVEAELGEVGIGGGKGGTLGTFPSKGDACSDKCCRNHRTSKREGKHRKIVVTTEGLACYGLIIVSAKDQQWVERIDCVVR